LETENGLFCEVPESRLRDTVLSTLHGKGYLQHRALGITVNQNTVIVDGIVPAWHLRQIALECIRRVPGVVRVVDQIRVVTGASDETSRLNGAVTNWDADSATTESVRRPGTAQDARQLDAEDTIFESGEACSELHGPGMPDASEFPAEHVGSLLNSWFGATDAAADRERRMQTACR